MCLVCCMYLDSNYESVHANAKQQQAAAEKAKAHTIGRVRHTHCAHCTHTAMHSICDFCKLRAQRTLLRAARSWLSPGCFPCLLSCHHQQSQLKQLQVLPSGDEGVSMGAVALQAHASSASSSGSYVHVVCGGQHVVGDEEYHGVMQVGASGGCVCR